MNATGEGNIVTLTDQLGHRLVTRQRGGNRQYKAHILRFGFDQGIVHAVVQGGEVQAVEVAVRIY
ncbi:hypothetical protein D3C78_1696380 [compost metagenome]